MASDKSDTTPRWKSIKSAPKNGKYVLGSGLNYGNGPERHYGIARFADGAWRSQNTEWKYFDKWLCECEEP